MGAGRKSGEKRRASLKDGTWLLFCPRGSERVSSSKHVRMCEEKERAGVFVVCPLKILIADQIHDANAVKLKPVELVSAEILGQPILFDRLFASAEIVSSKEFRVTLKPGSCI